MLWIFETDPGARVFINAHSIWPDLSHSWKPSISRSSGPFEIPKALNQAIISDWKPVRRLKFWRFVSFCLPRRSHYIFQLFSMSTHAVNYNLELVKPFFLFLFNIYRETPGVLALRSFWLKKSTSFNLAFSVIYYKLNELEMIFKEFEFFPTFITLLTLYYDRSSRLFHYTYFNDGNKTFKFWTHNKHNLNLTIKSFFLEIEIKHPLPIHILKEFL